MKKIYIAGKITGECETPELMQKCIDKFENYAKKFSFGCSKPAERFRTFGGDLFYTHGLWINRELIRSGNGTYQQYMKNDLTILMTCDEVHFLPDWIDSKGAKMERILAQFLGIKIVDVPMLP